MSIFRAGVPYAVDVHRLEESFPEETMNEGRVISHDEIEKIVNCVHGTSRYYGVTNSWRRKIKLLHGIHTKWQPKTGIVVLDPAQLQEHTQIRFGQKGKQLVRVGRDFAWVDRTRLNQSGQQLLDHQMRVANAITESIVRAKKEIAVNLGHIQSLPRPSLVETEKVS